VSDTAEIKYGQQTLTVPVVTGSENEKGLDIGQLRAKTGLVTLDPAFMNTASTKSAITFIDGDQGILRYRGIPIEELAEKSTFVETAYLLHLPGQQARVRRELPADDVRCTPRRVRRRPRDREGHEPAAHPPRRPRAELLDLDGARRRQRAANLFASVAAGISRSGARCTAAPTRRCSRCWR
jgi:hypothetical protein